MLAWFVVCAALCASVWLGCPCARAEEHAGPKSADNETAEPPRALPEQTTNLSDQEQAEGAPLLPPRKSLWDFFKVLPIFYYSKETSFGFGAGTLLQFDMPGAAGGRRPSTVAMGAVYTLENQIMGQITPDLRFGNDDYVLRADLAGAKYPSRFFGIGNDNSRAHFDPFTDRYFRGDLDFKMRPFKEGHPLRPLFVGANHAGLWSHMDGGGGDRLAAIEDRGERKFSAIGVGPSLTWDSRDSLSWPNHGSFAEAKATFFDPIFGGDLRYRRLAIDLRHYQRLWLDHILALRFVSQSVWGEVPFQRLPQLGGPSLFRGWFGGQLRDRLLVAIEAEYRVPLTKRLAVVAFGSVGRVARSVKHLDMRDLRVAGGGGVRFSVDKRDRVNIRLDLAYGDELSPCLQFREAF